MVGKIWQYSDLVGYHLLSKNPILNLNLSFLVNNLVLLFLVECLGAVEISNLNPFKRNTLAGQDEVYEIGIQA